MKRWMLVCVAALAGLTGLGVEAHTTVEKATPASGAVLDRSPPSIEVRFRHSVQVTSVIVVDAGGAERKLKFEPTGSTSVITIADPALHTGRNEVRWKALSKDGHVIGGTLSYTVKPAGASP